MKKIRFLIIAIVFAMIFPTTSNASLFSDAIDNARNFLRRGEQNTITYTNDDNETREANIAYDESQMKEAANNMYNMLAIIGSALATIVGGIIGIQFMMASAEDKAKIKESMLPYIAGMIVIFGAFGIWRLVVSILNNLA